MIGSWFDLHALASLWNKGQKQVNSFCTDRDGAEWTLSRWEILEKDMESWLLPELCLTCKNVSLTEEQEFQTFDTIRLWCVTAGEPCSLFSLCVCGGIFSCRNRWLHHYITGIKQVLSSCRISSSVITSAKKAKTERRKMLLISSMNSDSLV